MALAFITDTLLHAYNKLNVCFDHSSNKKKELFLQDY
jgi:hypothetical protein